MYQFGLIGCGSIARLHLQQIKRTGTLAGVYDVDPVKAEAFGRENQTKVYDTIEELLQQEDVQVISVCSPNGFHAEHSIKSLQAGKHVLCEAPLCITTAAAWQIIETEKFCRKKLCVTNMVSNQHKAKDLLNTINSPGSAQVVSFECTAGAGNLHPIQDWKRSIFPGGGTLYSYFYNYISLFTFLFGEIDHAIKPAPFCFAEGRETEESGEVVLQMKNGIRGRFSWSLKDVESSALLVRSNGTTLRLEQNEIAALTQPGADAYARVYDQLLHVVENKEVSGSLFDALKTVTCLERIYSANLSNPASTH